MSAPRNSYTFKEGLTMMAAKAVGIDPYMAAEAGENARAAINAIRNAAKTKHPKDRAEYIREAQNELRTISAAQHPKLVNALQAKVLALQGRGGDTAVAHVEPGEMVIPRAMLTPEVMELIASEAQRRGIDPRRLMVGGQGSINPATGAEEFGWFGDLLGGVGNKVRDIFGVKSAAAAEPDRRQLDVESIPVTATRRDENLNPSSSSASLITGGGLDLGSSGGETPRFKVPHWVAARVPDKSRSPHADDNRWNAESERIYAPTGASPPLRTGEFSSTRSNSNYNKSPDTELPFRQHGAYDFPSKPGDDVFAGMTGTITKIGQSYNPANFKKPWQKSIADMYKYVEVTSPSGHISRHNYVLPELKVGDAVEGGKARLGMSQDIALLYDDGTKNHVHMEVFDPRRNQYGIPKDVPDKRFTPSGSYRLDYLDALQIPEQFKDPDRRVKIGIGPLTTQIGTPRIRR
jgi:hypothetical protein